jgi:hypothetical protein
MPVSNVNREADLFLWVIQTSIYVTVFLAIMISSSLQLQYAEIRQHKQRTLPVLPIRRSKARRRHAKQEMQVKDFAGWEIVKGARN